MADITTGLEVDILTPKGSNVAASSVSVTYATDDPGLLHLTSLDTTVKAEGDVVGLANPGLVVLVERKDTPADAGGVSDGDYSILQMAGGRLWVDASGKTLTAAGDVAHDASDSGNPVKIGGQARTTNPTAVADADRVNAIFDKLGKQVVVGAIRELKGVTQTSISNSTSETTIVAAVASTFCDLYGLVFANTGATTTKVTIKDSTAGTTRMVFEVPTLETRGFMLPVDSAVPQSGTNANWTATCASATTAMEVTALFVKNT